MSRPTFRYVAVENGRTVSGTVIAESEQAVHERFAAAGAQVLKLRKLEKGRLRESFSFGTGISQAEIAEFARSMSVSLGASSLNAALRANTQHITNERFKRVLIEISQEVEGGKPLAEAVAGRGRIFPPNFAPTLRAAEASDGDLQGALRRLAEQIETAGKLRRTINSALIEPGITVGMTVVTLAVMVVFLVPTFQEVYEDAGSELPLVTRAALAVCDLARVTFPFYTAALLAGLWWWSRNKYDPRLRRRVDPLLLRLPMIGTMLKAFAIQRFAENYRVLLASGVPAATALDVCSETIGNSEYTRMLMDAKATVIPGKPMTEALERYPKLIPARTVAMLKAAEQAAGEEATLKIIADDYQHRAEEQAKRVTAFASPAIAAVAMIFTAAVMLAMIWPTMTVTEQLG